MEEGQTETVQMIFLFAVDSILTGVVSLFGFVSNTLAFVALRFCRHLAHENEPLASLLLFLQAVTISNIGVLWSIFLMHVIPALGFVMPLLEDCSRACQLIVALIHPIYLGSRALVAWMTVVSLACSGRIGSTTEKSSPRNALKSSSARFARWLIAVSTSVVCLWSILMIADSWIVLSRNGNSDTMSNDTLSNDTVSIMTLERSFWYRLIYVELTSVLTVVIPLLVGCGILFIRFSGMSFCCREIQSREFVKPMSRLFFFMFLCYVAEITSNVIDIVGQFSSNHKNGAANGWMIYLSAGSRLCVATYSSLGTLLVLLSHDDFRSAVRDTCLGKTPFRQELEKQKSRRIYRCDDATKVTLISQDDEGCSNIRDRERTKFVDSVYRPHGSGYADEETILTDGEVFCNV